MRKLAKIGLIAMTSLISVQLSAGVGTTQRCEDDKLTNATQGKGRNAWAVKCGYVPKVLGDAYSAGGVYAVLVPGGAPTDPKAPCNKNYSSAGACPVGCYEPGQMIMFGGQYYPIGKIQQLQTDATVSSLSMDGDFGEEQEIEKFIKGKEKSQLIVMELSNGKTLKVTKNHPLVRYSDGKMLAAMDLKSTDALLSPDMEKVEIQSIKFENYSGDVWNLNPVSKEKEHNVLSVEGVLTGSNRYQNQWADEFFRLNLRK